MKNSTMKLMIAAAAFVAVAGAASAQSLEASIPFAFRADGKTMPAGTYRVSMPARATGVPVFSIVSADKEHKLIAIAVGDGYAKHEWKDKGSPVLAFECAASGCELNRLWMGYGSSVVYKLPGTSRDKDEPTHVAEILMHPVKAY